MQKYDELEDDLNSADYFQDEKFELQHVSFREDFISFY